ncbi:hypothetical protein [Pseudoalteromonas phage GXT1010]|nr:hypothetical protein [Pseudoalteromonas phage GXT1010]
MGKFLNKNLLLILAAAVGVYVYRQIDEKSKAITKPIGNALAEIQFLFNGSNRIEYVNAGFFLNPDKLDHSLRVIGGGESYWYRAMVESHKAHQLFLDEIFDSDFRLRPMYKPLLNGLVDYETITTAAKV